MHEGSMIFAGSMRDMKRRLKRNAFRLDLEGSDEEIQRLVDQANALEGVEVTQGGGSTLLVQFADEVRAASTLSLVLKLADTANLTLQNVTSGQNETEDVYLQLLQEDEAHGFQRFLEAGSEDHAVHGDSLA